MKQIIQNYKTGELRLVDVSVPGLRKGFIRVRTHASLVSVGTERTMLDLARKSLLGKAVARPDLVKQVLNKIRTDGLGEAYRQAMGRLDTPLPLGNSAAGIVTGVGEGVDGFSVGDRVACSGSGYASHSEIICVPQTLTVRIPDGVSDEAASFVTLGSIAMHGIRTANVTFGERVVVLGLGLLGQLAVQILSASACRVLGLDTDARKVELALAHGTHAGAVIGKDDVSSAVRHFTNGEGADAVLIFASTESNEPIELAAEISRERGRIVVPGLVGLQIPRKQFYAKEIDFVVSRAWGPGVYDPEYESGSDYPLPFVRWTAQRNMGHFLGMMSDGKVRIDHLVTHRFPLEQALDAYDMILEGKEPVIGLVLHYPRTEGESPPRTHVILQPEKEVSKAVEKGTVHIGVIGAGLFTRGTLLPILKETHGIAFRGICTSTGISGGSVGEKYGFHYATTDPVKILEDADTTLVMVLTRHGSHSKWVCEALRARKNVFVEKPLSINESQLAQIIQTHSESRPLNSEAPFLMVGFNRRFAPMTQEAIGFFSRVPRPLMVSVRVNVGHIPKESWVHDPEEGGGNIIGEVCHFVDLIQAVTGSSPVRVYAQSVRASSDGVIAGDNVVITLTLADGSVGTITYSAMGDKAYGKERVEIFGGGTVCVIDNFRKMTWSHLGKHKQKGHFLRGADRGHRAEMNVLISALQSGQGSPVSFQSYVATTRATFAVMESLRTGSPVDIDPSL
jgi:predicted dehydrogenase/threonine dehydrogenase-like Zn-dependent dehydrogenase